MASHIANVATQSYDLGFKHSKPKNSKYGYNNVKGFAPQISSIDKIAKLSSLFMFISALFEKWCHDL